MYTVRTSVLVQRTLTHSWRVWQAVVTNRCPGRNGAHCPLMLRDSALMTQLEQLLSTTVIYFLHLWPSSNNNYRPLSPPGCSPNVSPAPNLFCQHRLQQYKLTDEERQPDVISSNEGALFATITPFLILSYFVLVRIHYSHYFPGPVQWSLMVFFNWSITVFTTLC